MQSNEKLLFSIVVPVYNVQDYLERCVASLTAQDYPRIEIILVDDGSTDCSGTLCDACAQADARIRVVHKPNGGLSSARNAGLASAAGDYGIFLASDDYVERGTCRILAERLAEHPGADMIAYDGWEEEGQERRDLRRISGKSCTTESGSAFLLRNYRDRNLNVEAWLYASRIEFLRREELCFREGILHEDVEFTPRALLKAERVLTIPDCFYHYIIREGSISTGKSRVKNIEDLFATLKEQSAVADEQEKELGRWMKNAILDSYLNMIYDARMYQPQYRKYVEKSFLLGKAATPWNHIRVCLCLISVRLYCSLNDLYKKRGMHG
ncbi:MAG: glycosyltransferase [Lachnospiraceae bacterium]|nr:glycosyltransferase [Lachnospiraceae bacterium]